VVSGAGWVEKWRQTPYDSFSSPTPECRPATSAGLGVVQTTIVWFAVGYGVTALAILLAIVMSC
jgi:hypothetical protein